MLCIRMNLVEIKILNIKLARLAIEKFIIEMVRETLQSKVDLKMPVIRSGYVIHLKSI